MRNRARAACWLWQMRAKSSRGEVRNKSGTCGSGGFSSSSTTTTGPPRGDLPTSAMQEQTISATATTASAPLRWRGGQALSIVGTRRNSGVTAMATLDMKVDCVNFNLNFQNPFSPISGESINFWRVYQGEFTLYQFLRSPVAFLLASFLRSRRDCPWKAETC